MILLRMFFRNIIRMYCKVQSYYQSGQKSGSCIECPCSTTSEMTTRTSLQAKMTKDAKWPPFTNHKGPLEINFVWPHFSWQEYRGLVSRLYSAITATQITSVSNRQPHDCLLNRLFRRRSKKTSKLRVTGLCEGNSLLTGEFPAQRASKADSVIICWRHRGHT